MEKPFSFYFAIYQNLFTSQTGLAILLILQYRHIPVNTYIYATSAYTYPYGYVLYHIHILTYTLRQYAHILK